MSFGIGRLLKPVLYIEGKRLDNALIAATCTSKIGSPATASIELTPTNSIKFILPRTHVALFVNDPWSDSTDPVLLFEGEVLGTGFTRRQDSRSFVIHCADVSNYWHHVRQFWFNLSQSGGNFLDQFIHMTTGGAGRIGTVAPFGVQGYLIKKLNMVSGQENLFLDSLIALLDDIGNISAFYQNARRRLKITDRVIRKNAGNVQNLFQLSFFSDWVQQIVQARSGETNLLSIITLLLNIIYHEYVSLLAPPYITADVIARDVFGNPVRTTDPKTKSTKVQTEERKIIGNFIFKPHIYTLPPPTCNVLFPNMYSGISYTRNFMAENTRMTLTPQVMNNSSLGLLKLKVFKRPQELDNFFQLITDKNSQLTLKRPTIAKYGDGQGQSSRVQEFEFMTNEERFKGIVPTTQGLAPAPALLTVANQGKKSSTGGREGGAPQYIHNVASYEYFMNKFVSRSFGTEGVFNIRPIVGYPMLIVDDSEANLNFVAYLQEMTHVLNASSGATTQYTFVLPREVDEIDLNRPAIDDSTGDFKYEKKDGVRVFNFDKMFDSANVPPIPDWFDDAFKKIGTLNGIYQSFFGKDVYSVEDIQNSDSALQKIVEANSTPSTSGQSKTKMDVSSYDTNSIFRQAVKILIEDYQQADKLGDAFSFVSAYTKRQFTSVDQAFLFLGAIAKNIDSNGVPISVDTDYVGVEYGKFVKLNADQSASLALSKQAVETMTPEEIQATGTTGPALKGYEFTKAEVDISGKSTSNEHSGFALYDGKPIPHPFEMKLYEDSVAKAQKDNQKAAEAGKKKTLTSAENAPTGTNVQGAPFQPFSYPLSEANIIKARRSIIDAYRLELEEKRGFRG